MIFIIIPNNLSSWKKSICVNIRFNFGNIFIIFLIYIYLSCIFIFFAFAIIFFLLSHKVCISYDSCRCFSLIINSTSRWVAMFYLVSSTGYFDISYGWNIEINRRQSTPIITIISIFFINTFFSLLSKWFTWTRIL